MSNISYAGSLGLSVVISAQFAFLICVAARNCQKVNKTPILALKAMQGH